ncbi:MAG: UDP-N-acetylmuramate dehydrogenase [Alphaproteobacteria bacterium]|nr:UDP-N-acetylmuramate dehydrogenase [Alphaproteobacteria bacterium]
MSAARKHDAGLLDRLPKVRGEMIANEPLDRFTWFRVGGPAEVLFHPADRDDLATFLAEKPSDVPVTVVGGASNLLIRDGGIEGVVVKLGRGFRDVEIGAVFEEVDFEPINGGTDYVMVNAGAGAANIQVARACRDAGLGSTGDIAVAGLEFLSGIPGTIGGALRMNAGAYGGEMAGIVVHAKALDPKGTLHRIPLAKLGYSYRHCELPDDWIFTGAALRGVLASKDAVAGEIERIANAREESQPLRTRTGGSTFRNPDGKRAWELIDEAGCRGLRRGAAMVSEKHCNFLINTGDASAADLEDLGDDVRSRVKDATGIELHWEIKRIGRRLDDHREDAA